MTSQIQAILGAWAMAAVGLLNAFFPGINDVQQTALTGFAGVTVTLFVLIFNKSAPDTIDKDPAADFERARIKLARHSGIIMPGIDEVAASTSVAKTEGWPPPQDNS